MKYIQTDMK